MPLLAGAVVPHAPLLVTGVSAAFESEAGVVRAAVARIALPQADVVVIVSPHGRGAGVYRSSSGSLDAFGVPGRSATVNIDAGLTRRLGRAWDVRELTAPLDHGITVPALIGAFPEHAPVVACTVPETTGPGAASVGAALDAADALGTAVLDIAAELRVVVLVSAHGSAALSPRAPLAERPAGRDLDEAILAAFDHDAGDLALIPGELWAAAGSCGAAPLVLLGHLFADAGGELLAYEAPAGVGYLVAVLEAP